MPRVITSSRLHFGLFALPAEGVTHWPNSQGECRVPVRRFGGVGLMIDAPGVEVVVEPAATWSAQGSSSERALAFAKQLIHSLPEPERRAFTISVVRCAPEHAGLGTGTQLGLAVARALALATGHADWNGVELARRIGRGLRSSLGIHGFDRGGFLVEGGKRRNDQISPLLMREPLPDEWRVLLILPRGRVGTHGAAEREAFAALGDQVNAQQRTDALCRLVLLAMLPALVERDLETFGEALYDFNRRVGEMFAKAQGGIYSSQQTAALIEWLRKNGVHGVGQTSWGPTVFAIADADKLNDIKRRLASHEVARDCDLTLCRAANEGARYTE